MAQEKKLSVAAIKQGTVIDHITAGHALKIIRLLDLADHKKVVTVGLNLPSKAMGLKDIIKVEGRELTPEEIRRVAVFAPQGSINIIRNYQIIKKFATEIPNIIEYVMVCPNPNCITNNEIVDTKFDISHEKKHVKFKCHYCEKVFDQDEITEYKHS